MGTRDLYWILPCPSFAVQTQECRNRDWGPTAPFLRTFVSNFLYCVFAVQSPDRTPVGQCCESTSSKSLFNFCVQQHLYFPTTNVMYNVHKVWVGGYLWGAASPLRLNFPRDEQQRGQSYERCTFLTWKKLNSIFLPFRPSHLHFCSHSIRQ